MTHDERDKLITQYGAGYSEVVDALKGFPEKDLIAHPIAGKWSAREIIHHLADSESNSAVRLRKLLTEEYPVMQSYDQALYAVLLRYNTRDHEPALDLFRTIRETTFQILKVMSDEDWTRPGWHPEHGLYTAAVWLKIYADHAHNHAGQIRRLKSALGH
ncbi:MAG TPA: DinB family protein [Candidatus Udaeobacter sp.]|jgi:hypothetical protein|nr:DinB family protein [Candidatus Udaeobacter sp.]